MKINVNGVNYYCEWLSSYEKERSTLVCLHGFTGTSQTFTLIAQEISTHMNILSIDLIGHGQTDVYVHPYRYQMPSLCQDIAQLTEQLALPHFCLLGYSMGARTALAFTCLFPRKVTQLVLESGSPGLESQTKRALRSQTDHQLAQLILTQPIEVFVKRWEALPLFSSQKNLPAQLQKKIRQERLSQQPFGLACSLWFMGTGMQKSLWNELAYLTCPLLLIVGELDMKFQIIAEKMQKVQPRITIKSIKAAGHCPHVEKPQVFIETLQLFLKEGVFSNVGDKD